MITNHVPHARELRFRERTGENGGALKFMPARETEAIILKTFPLGEADRLVSFLGRDTGRMRGVAAGARRIKNRYGSTLQLLSHVQLWYVEKETRDLVRIQQTEPLESFNKSQSDYFLSTGLAIISEVAELVLPEREVSEPMFRLMLLTTQEIERTGEWFLPLGYFAFWTVRLGGWLPRFDRCANCGNEFGAHAAYFGSWEPGLVCGEVPPLGNVWRCIQRPGACRTIHGRAAGSYRAVAQDEAGRERITRSGARMDRASHRSENWRPGK